MVRIYNVTFKSTTEIINIIGKTEQSGYTFCLHMWYMGSSWAILNCSLTVLPILAKGHSLSPVL